MPTVDFTATTRRASLPLCFVFATFQAGAWRGVCLYGPDEHSSREGFRTRDEALADAQKIAANLLRNDIGGAL
jgi:hypothetical protein